MRPLPFLLLLVLLVLLVLRVREAGRDRGRRPAVPEAEPAPVAPPEAEVPARTLPDFEVRVVIEPHGDPLIGVGVRVEWQSGDPHEAKTDEQGVARFELEAGRRLRRCTVEATAETPIRSVTDFRVEPDFLEIRVPRGGVLAGRVLDPDGRPLGGVVILGCAVAHRGRAGFEARPDLQPVAKSGGDGAFVVEGFSGKFFLRTGGDDLTPVVRAEGRIDPGEEIGDLLLVAATHRTLTGRVVDAEGLPVPEAYVFLADVSPGWKGSTYGPSRSVDPGLDMRTDIEGRFRFERVPRALLEIEVASTNHYDEPRLVPADRDHVIVTLGPSHLPASFVGVVRTREGEPIPDAQLKLDAPSLSSRGRSDRQGRFRIETQIVRDPRYPFRRPFQLLAFAPGRASRRMEWPKLEPGVNRVELVLDPERIITGTVVDPGKEPIRGANVRLREPGKPRPYLPHELGWTKSDDQGRFRFGQLWDGEFLLQSGRREEVRVVAGATDVVLGPGATARISLRLVHARDGTPIERARIMIRDDTGGHGSDKEAPGGIYRVPPRAPGRLGFGVRVQGFAPRSIGIRDWPAGEHEVEVELYPARRLRLRLLDAHGSPVVGARVVPQWPDGSPMAFDSLDPRRGASQLPKTGWGGRCWFERLPATRIRLSILPPDAPEPFPRELDLGSHDGSEVDIRVP